jgi:hypothetical protein
MKDALLFNHKKSCTFRNDKFTANFQFPLVPSGVSADSSIDYKIAENQKAGFSKKPDFLLTRLF